ncbi:translation initiation factor eIF2 assembly protein [Trichomonascus vanleenenianus]|uniref:cell proliferation protein CDC123 n=1 Tax=Trichomonascus vanleenenianus TaxID=2268995 RepID=UPI003ECA1A7D
MPGSTSESTIKETKVPPNATKQQILNCMYSSWHDQYRQHTPKSAVLKPLPQPFIDYLLSDGLVLPRDEAGYDWQDEKSENGDFDENDNEADEAPDPSEAFKDFHEEVKKAVQDLGGKVTPKLNWSSPRDATWISTTNDLKCVNASDIYMLLKASSYITHDLTEAFYEASDKDAEADFSYELVLKKWVDVNPAMEFRCFVKDREIIGITQRDMNHYDYLEGLKPQLQHVIELFFDDNLRTTFPDSDFVFDVYIPKPFNRAWLIDINPFAGKTDTKLYSWQQLMDIDPMDEDFEPEFRLVDKLDSSRGFGYVEHSENAVPKDFVDASTSGQGIAELARQWQAVLNMQKKEDDEDSESSE